MEFALIAPVLIMLLIGTTYAGLLIYSETSLQNAVEAGARCYSVNANQCLSAAAAQTYALQAYQGVSTPTFLASTPSCGHQVSATLTLRLNAGMVNWTVPMAATACFP